MTRHKFLGPQGKESETEFYALAHGICCENDLCDQQHVSIMMGRQTYICFEAQDVKGLQKFGVKLAQELNANPQLAEFLPDF